jgi:hypothetical protein
MGNEHLVGPTEPVADELTAREQRAADMRAEYASEQDDADRNDAWGMP